MTVEGAYRLIYFRYPLSAPVRCCEIPGNLLATLLFQNTCRATANATLGTLRRCALKNSHTIGSQRVTRPSFLATVSTFFTRTRTLGLSVAGRKQVVEEEQRSWEMLSEERKKEVKVILPTKKRGRGEGGEGCQWPRRTAKKHNLLSRAVCVCTCCSR